MKNKNDYALEGCEKGFLNMNEKGMKKCRTKTIMLWMGCENAENKNIMN